MKRVQGLRKVGCPFPGGEENQIPAIENPRGTIHASPENETSWEGKKRKPRRNWGTRTPPGSRKKKKSS